MQRLPGRGGVAVPLLLHIDKGVPVTLLAVEDRGEDGRTERGEECRDDPRPVAAPVGAMTIPEQRQKGQDKKDPAGTAQCRGDTHQSRQPEHVAPPEVERAGGEEEKERFRVDRGEEERRREEGQRPDARRAVSKSP